MKMPLKKLRAAGFSQKRPKVPGIYYIAHPHDKMEPHNPQRFKEGWDVASIFYQIDGQFLGFGSYDSGAESGIWYIETMGGVSYAWRKGMWIKGPISPFLTPGPTTPNARRQDV